ncbi:RagB/SusD family nutrient uptake outer membrane protein [Massilibacteroides vaginae]|uniref:RagB/SusD family nutrient uptake outer membrane protein n=1 Tax=Massilibacteroides vaginae TaxID=1673718 RepID=UPI000A1C9716|nr:RagB/SusD family nutrient uptake outer membrane protein [Massilibacteroides vaginae]
MKNILSLTQAVLLIGCMLLPCSCDDFLTKEPPGVASGAALETDQGVESLLVGAYAALRGEGRFGGAMGTDWTYGSGASDDCYKGTESGDQTNFNDVERYTVLPTNAYMAERWRDCYNGVARSNKVLEFLKVAQKGSSPFTEERAKQVEAEAKFLRAWFHFQANKIFKTIPYIKTLEELGGVKPEDVPNKDAGWDEIENDLQFAIDNLPEDKFPGQPGRAIKYSAMAVKAHAHMYQNELDQAKVLLDQIIQSNKYKLVANYFDNFDERTENNEESIFEIQCSASPVNKTSMLLAGPVMHQSGGGAALGWGFYQPSQTLVDAYQVEDNGLPILDITKRKTIKNDMGIESTEEFTPTDQLVDLRLDWTVSRRGVDFLGWGICEGRSWVRAQENGGPYMTKKFMHFSESQASQNGSGFDNNRNFRMYRYSHVLLWRAECAVEEGDLTKARELVNQIRNRVKTSNPVMGLCKTTKFSGGNIEVEWDKPAANYKTEPYPDNHSAFSSKENAREAVRMEIRLEFATEGQRFFDLRRWGNDIEVLNDYIKRDGTFRIFMHGAKYTDKNRYWPIPQAQLDIQPALTQNPDYL